MRILLPFLLLVSSAVAADKTYVWRGVTRNMSCLPPETYVDGSPIPDTAVLKFRWYAAIGDAFPTLLTETAECKYSHTFDALGNIALTVTAFEENRGESVYSETYFFHVDNEPAISHLLISPNSAGTGVTPVSVPYPTGLNFVSDYSAQFQVYSETKQFPNTTAIKYAKRWEVDAFLLSNGVKQGLVSRDRNGQNEGGHTSLWVEANGIVSLRNQQRTPADGGAAESVKISSPDAIEPNKHYHITARVDDGNLELAINGVTVATASSGYPMSENNLPLTVGGICSSCGPDDTGFASPINGTVRVRLYPD